MKKVTLLPYELGKPSSNQSFSVTLSVERLTLEERTYLPHGDWPLATKLPQTQLEEHQWHPTHDEHDAIRDKEGTCNDTQQAMKTD